MATRTLLSSLLALLLSSPALAENSVKVCVDDPGGLVVKTAELGSGSCPSLSTPYEVIGVWVFWEIGASQFAEEFTGHELFSCFDSGSETVIQQRDTSGQEKGAKRKTFTPNGNPPTSLVEIPTAVADTASAGQVQWIVKNGGNGGQYNGAVESCRTLVGYPPS